MKTDYVLIGKEEGRQVLQALSATSDIIERRGLLIYYYEYARDRWQFHQDMIEKYADDYFLIYGHVCAREKYQGQMEIIFLEILTINLIIIKQQNHDAH